MIGEQLLRIETCVKQGDRFIPLSSVTKLLLKDPNYVDGSIRVFVGNQALITDVEWTDIVQWWANMSNVIRELLNGARNNLKLYFPDSTAEMCFKIDGNKLTWEVISTELRSADMNFLQALQILIEEYKHTFEKLKLINPARISDYDNALNYLIKFRPFSAAQS